MFRIIHTYFYHRDTFTLCHQHRSKFVSPLLKVIVKMSITKLFPDDFCSKCSSVHTAAWEHCKSATVISLKVGFKLPPSFSSLLFSGALISVYFFVSFNFCAVRLWANWALLTRWSFFNYVGQILPIIDHLPSTYPLLTLVREFLYIVIYKENSEYRWHFQYPLPTSSFQT